MEERSGRIPPPFSLGGLDHLLLLVKDMNAAIGFYERVLGCAERVRLPQFAMVEMDAGRNSLALVAYLTPKGPGRGLRWRMVAISITSPYPWTPRMTPKFAAISPPAG